MPGGTGQVDVVFARALSRVPDIVALPHGTDPNTVLSLKISGISASGFTIRAGILASGSNNLSVPPNDLAISWVAIAK